ncbi:MAG: hypothetical protein QM796_22000 [Chthoniobacteraceae bacterium]
MIYPGPTLSARNLALNLTANQARLAIDRMVTNLAANLTPLTAPLGAVITKPPVLARYRYYNKAIIFVKLVITTDTTPVKA